MKKKDKYKRAKLIQNYDLDVEIEINILLLSF